MHGEQAKTGICFERNVDDKEEMGKKQIAEEH
jgi:hypothetical protein